MGALHQTTRIPVAAIGSFLSFCFLVAYSPDEVSYVYSGARMYRLGVRIAAGTGGARAIGAEGDWPARQDLAGGRSSGGTGGASGGKNVCVRILLLGKDRGESDGDEHIHSGAAGAGDCAHEAAPADLLYQGFLARG
jgi:hypothetical protein